jgi:hypothetical protein
MSSPTIIGDGKLKGMKAEEFAVHDVPDNFMFLESVYKDEYDVDTLYTLSFGLQPGCLFSMTLKCIARLHLSAKALILPHAPPSHMYILSHLLLFLQKTL